MEFDFPFPTLKQLAIISICQHWSDHNLGFFSEIRKGSTAATDVIFRLFRNNNHMINRLSLPAALKTAVSEALFGICKQIRTWAEYYPRYRSVDKFFFDSNGIFDIGRTMEHFYKNQVAETEDFHFLLELLSEAGERIWLSEIDMVLRKMIAVAIQSTEDPFQGLRYHRQSNTLEMRYKFRRNLDSKIIGKIRDYTFTSEYASMGTYRKCVFVKLSLKLWDMKLIENGIIHGLLRREDNVKYLIQCLFYEKQIPTSYLLKVLTYINNSKGRSWVSYVETYTHFHTYIKIFLFRLLTSPFTTFYAPALKSLSPQLNTTLCLEHLLTVCQSVLHQQWCGVLQGDVLREFWTNLPIQIRREMALTYKKRIDDSLKALTKKLTHKHTIFICRAIMTELDVLDTNSWRNRLRPRKRKHQ